MHNIHEIAYTDTELLEKFLTPLGKIAPSRRTKVCSKHQRALAKGIKRAREMALLPYTRR